MSEGCPLGRPSMLSRSFRRHHRSTSSRKWRTVISSGSNPSGRPVTVTTAFVPGRRSRAEMSGRAPGHGVSSRRAKAGNPGAVHEDGRLVSGYHRLGACKVSGSQDPLDIAAVHEPHGARRSPGVAIARARGLPPPLHRHPVRYRNTVSRCRISPSDSSGQTAALP